MNPYIMLPEILKESSDGSIRTSIQSELFLERKIFCVGEINEESVYTLILQLQYLYMKDSQKEITLFIDTPGGQVSSGFAVYDVMKIIDCPIRTICIGMAASMGALLFASGDIRCMLPHARIMIHDPLIAGGIGGSALKIDSISRDLMKTRKIMAEILAAHTGRGLDEILEKTASDSYFNAEEALAWGLADTIVEKL